MAVHDDTYRLDARDKPGLLMAMMRALAGNARIALEGDLSRCAVSRLVGASGVETAALRRGTLFPKQDFTVLPLEPDTLQPILEAVLPEGRLVDGLEHVQIEKDGGLAFGAFDGFHPRATECGPAVPVALLEALVAQGILRSFRRAG